MGCCRRRRRSNPQAVEAWNRLVAKLFRLRRAQLEFNGAGEALQRYSEQIRQRVKKAFCTW